MLTCTLPKGFAPFAKSLKSIVNKGFGVLRFIRVEAKDGVMHLEGTDKEHTLTLAMPVDGDQEPILMDGEEFLKAVKGAKKFTLTPALAGGSIKTESGVFALAFQPMSDDFNPQSHEGKAIGTLDLTKEVLDFAASAVSRDATKPTLSGVLLDFSMKGVNRIAATDGFRLSVAETKTKGARHPRIVLLRKTVQILRDLTMGPVDVAASKDAVTFQGQGWILTSRVLSGNYPAIEKVMPSIDSLERVYTFNREAFLEGVQKASKVADDYCKSLRLFLADKMIAMEFIHPDGPVGTAVVDMKTKSEPIELAFDHRYLEGAAGSTPGVNLSYACKDEIGVGIFEGDTKGPWTMRTYIMPVRFASVSRSVSEREGVEGESPAEKAKRTAEETIQGIRVKVVEIAKFGAIKPDGHTCQADFGQLGRLVNLTIGKANYRLPILGMVRLEGTPGSLHASMSDMEVFLSMSFPAKGDGHPAVLVDRDLFRSALKDAQSITLADGGCSTPAVSLSTVKADDYPLFPETHSAAGDPAVMAYLTKAGLAFAAAAASTDSTKPAMSSVRMELEAGKAGVTLVTTDGFRLATGSFCGTVPAESGAFLLPARLVSILSALIEDGAPVGIRMGERHVTFQGASWALTTQVVEGKFPRYRGAVPAEDQIPHTFKVLDRVAFKKSLAMVAAKTDDYNRDLSLEVNGITGCLVVDHPDTGKATAEFPCQADAPVAPGLKFNVDYLQSLVDRAQDAVMVFRFGAQGTPWLFEELLGHGVSAKALLMPFIPAGPKGGVEPPAEAEVAEAVPDPTPAPEAPSQEEGTLEEVVAAAAPDAEMAQTPAVEPPPAEESDTLAVWRQDAKAVRALGGREALQAAKYKVKWEMKQSHGFTSYQPQCWFVPKSVLAELGITPISEAEAMEIFRARSAKAKAAHAA